MLHESDSAERRPGAEAASQMSIDGDTPSVATASPRQRITGEVFVDLTDVAENNARNRVYNAVVETPPGATVVLYVGPLRINYEVVRIVAEFGPHVAIKVSGHAAVVGNWIEALRGNGEVIL